MLLTIARNNSHIHALPNSAAPLVGHPGEVLLSFGNLGLETPPWWKLRNLVCIPSVGSTRRAEKLLITHLQNLLLFLGLPFGAALQSLALAKLFHAPFLLTRGAVLLKQTFP